MELGNLDLDESKWPVLAKAIAVKLSSSRTLFEFDSEIENLSDGAISRFNFVKTESLDNPFRQESGNYCEVDIDSTSVTEVKSLGNELVALSYLA